MHLPVHLPLDDQPDQAGAKPAPCLLYTSMTKEGSNAFILVEQHAEIALSLTEMALVLERGRVVHSGASASLLADHAALDRLVGLRLAEV